MTGSLKPCPFCGATYSEDRSKRGPLQFCTDDQSVPWSVYCWECGTENAGYTTEVEAIAAWNRRPPSPAAGLTPEDAAFVRHMAALDAQIPNTQPSRQRNGYERDIFHLLAIITRAFPLTRPNAQKGDAPMTPEQASDRLVELRGNKDWTKRYFAGDKECIAEYDRLIAAVGAQP